MSEKIVRKKVKHNDGRIYLTAPESLKNAAFDRATEKGLGLSEYLRSLLVADIEKRDAA